MNSGDYSIRNEPSIYPLTAANMLTWQAFGSTLQDDCDSILLSQSSEAASLAAHRSG